MNEGPRSVDCRAGYHTAYSDEVDHAFRAKLSTCSGPSCPPIPSEAVRIERGYLKGCWNMDGSAWSWGYWASLWSRRAASWIRP